MPFWPLNVDDIDFKLWSKVWILVLIIYNKNGADMLFWFQHHKKNSASARDRGLSGLSRSCNTNFVSYRLESLWIYIGNNWTKSISAGVELYNPMDDMRQIPIGRFKHLNFTIISGIKISPIPPLVDLHHNLYMMMNCHEI